MGDEGKPRGSLGFAGNMAVGCLPDGALAAPARGQPMALAMRDVGLRPKDPDAAEEG